MTQLFRRSWSIQIGTTRISSISINLLTVKFSVEKSLEREPNRATVRIANLSEALRRRIELEDDPQLEIRAGYEDLEDVIFVGDVRDAWSERDGADIWLVVESDDGGRSYRTARIARSFQPGTALATVIYACVDAIGVGRGNSTQIAPLAELDSGGTIFANGYTVDGVAWRELDRVCRSASLRWSIQSGVIQLRRAGQPAETRAIRLSPGTGLVGSPSRGKRDPRQRRKRIGARSLLIPGLYPGRVVVLESAEVEGNWLCRRTNYIGDSSGQDWYVDLELEEY